MGDRIAVMKLGVLQQVGTPEELYTTPANVFVAGFIGSPSMNVVRGGRRSRASAGRGVLAGFRPEHVDVGTDVGRRGLASPRASRSSSTSATSSSSTCAWGSVRCWRRSRSSRW